MLACCSMKMKAVLWSLNLVMLTGKIRKEKIARGRGATQKEVDGCKRGKACTAVSYQEPYSVGHWPSSEPIGGVSGQLGPGEVVTTVPGPGAPALGDGSMGPGVRLKFKPLLLLGVSLDETGNLTEP